MGADRPFVDPVATINEYLSQADWRVQANANQGFSLGGMILNTSGKITANWWLSHAFSEKAGKAHRNGDYHIHDLDMLCGYCAGWSLRMLLEEGFNGIPGKVETWPPKHLSSATGQMVNFMGSLQNEWAGAMAFSSVDTLLAPFVKVDGLSFKEVKQAIQVLIFNLNVPSRWGSQTVFSNCTFDLTCPTDMKDRKPIIGGTEQDFTYGELQAEMDLVNMAYMEVMYEGDAKGRIFTFPIPTYNITEEFDWDSPVAEKLFEMTAKFGMPYFQNFLNSDLNPEDVRSMCCRLQLSLTELRKRGNGLFGSAEQTGSIGVVTLNMARLGYRYAGKKDKVVARIKELVELASEVLETRREVVTGLLDKGFLPFTKRYLGTFRNHFSTIGTNGMNEFVLNYTDGAYGIQDDRGKELAMELLGVLRHELEAVQQRTGNMYNLEATPAESATYRMARLDHKVSPESHFAGAREPYYTNSSQLPVDATTDFVEALEHQTDLQRQYTGGTVFHLFVGERIETTESCKKLVRRVLSRFKIPYLTITPTFSICPEHGYLAGEQQICPECGARCEVWTRVMGYHRPVTEFNRGKRSEYEQRKMFTV